MNWEVFTVKETLLFEVLLQRTVKYKVQLCTWTQTYFRRWFEHYCFFNTCDRSATVTHSTLDILIKGCHRDYSQQNNSVYGFYDLPLLCAWLSIFHPGKKREKI